MKLVYAATGVEVGAGDVITDPHNGAPGETWTVESIERPRHGGSTGRVYITSSLGYSQGYYPGVIGAEWVGRTDQD